MRNSKFVRYGVVLLGLVVLRPKAQNGFCPMCTKGCYTVMTRSKLFWGQFWGQICETDSRTLQSNKCAAFVPLRNADTNITRFSHRKSPTNRYISFTLRQEVVCKPNPQHSRTPPLSPRETPLFGRVRTASAMGADYTTASQSAPFRGALPLPERLHESSFIFGLCCKPSTQPDDPVRFCRAFPAHVSYAHHPDLQRGHPESKTVSHRQRGHPQATDAYTA